MSSPVAVLFKKEISCFTVLETLIPFPITITGFLLVFSRVCNLFVYHQFLSLLDLTIGSLNCFNFTIFKFRQNFKF